MFCTSWRRNVHHSMRLRLQRPYRIFEGGCSRTPCESAADAFTQRLRKAGLNDRAAQLVRQCMNEPRMLATLFPIRIIPKANFVDMTMPCTRSPLLISLFRRGPCFGHLPPTRRHISLSTASGVIFRTLFFLPGNIFVFFVRAAIQPLMCGRSA